MTARTVISIRDLGLFIPYFFGILISFSFSPLSSNINGGNSSKFDVLSLNVRGIRDQIKRRSIFSYLKVYNTYKLFTPTGLNGRRETLFVGSFVVEAESR